MANTRVLTVNVEDFVRTELERRYGEPFRKRRLPITDKGFHEFDAVAESGSIVASIKSSSGRTSGNKIPSGKIASAVAEMYYLSLVSTSHRLLVLTNPDFFEIMTRTLTDRVGHSIEIVHIPLPEALLALAAAAHKSASIEISELGNSSVVVRVEE